MMEYTQHFLDMDYIPYFELRNLDWDCETADDYISKYKLKEEKHIDETQKNNLMVKYE